MNTDRYTTTAKGIEFYNTTTDVKPDYLYIHISPGNTIYKAKVARLKREWVLTRFVKAVREYMSRDHD